MFWLISLFQLLYFFQNRLFTVYCLPAVLRSYEVFSTIPRLCVSDICRQEDNFILENSHGI